MNIAEKKMTVFQICFTGIPKLFLLKENGSIINLSQKGSFSQMDKSGFNNIFMVASKKCPKEKKPSFAIVGASPYFIPQQDFLSMLQAECGGSKEGLFQEMASLFEKEKSIECVVINSQKNIRATEIK